MHSIQKVAINFENQIKFSSDFLNYLYLISENGTLRNFPPSNGTSNVSFCNIFSNFSFSCVTIRQIIGTPPLDKSKTLKADWVWNRCLYCITNMQYNINPDAKMSCKKPFHFWNLILICFMPQNLSTTMPWH